MEEKNDVINVKVNTEFKKEAEKVFEKYGITMTDAITLYLREVIKCNGIPFKLVANSKKK